MYLAFAYGAWTLKSWGWRLGVVAAVASSCTRPRSWFIAALGLFFWFRPDVKTAFERA